MTRAHHHWRQRLFQGAVRGLLVGMIGGLIFSLPFGLRLEEETGLVKLFDWRGVVTPATDAIVIAIDNDTIRHLGLSRDTRDWDRSIHACLVDALARLGASVLIFDVAFLNSRSQTVANKPEPNPAVLSLCPDAARPEDPDRTLAQALRRSGNVVLVQPISVERTEAWTREQLVTLTPEVANAAVAVVPFPLPKVPAKVNQFWTFKSSLGDIPTLPVAALQARRRASLDALWAAYPETGELDRSAQLQINMQALRRLFRRHRANQATGPMTAEQQGMAQLYRGPESVYLNFYGPPRTIRTLSYSKVLAAAQDGDDLKLDDKVVFIGAAAISTPQQRDGYHTAFTTDDGVDLSGVEIAATAYANLATGRFVRQPELRVSLLLLMLLGGLLGLIFSLLSSVAAVALAVALSIAYGYLALSLFSTNALWLPLAVPILLQLPASLLLGLFSQYQRERRRRIVIGNALNRYVPEAIAGQILDSGGDLACTKTEATLLYCDIAGFSTITERSRPDVVVAMLNEYFSAVAGPIVSHGGVITQFQGDALLATFNVPARLSDHADAAVRAAIAMIAITHTQRFAGMLLNIRIGIDTGEVVAGNVGSGDRLNYTVHGDAVNVAARLEQYNKELGSEILLSEHTVALLKDSYPLETVGKLQIRGRTQTLGVYKCTPSTAEASAANGNYPPWAPVSHEPGER